MTSTTKIAELVAENVILRKELADLKASYSAYKTLREEERSKMQARITELTDKVIAVLGYDEAMRRIVAPCEPTPLGDST